ncbi:MAG: type VI secretion system tube protein Hcp [Pseudomonadota bacterium]
MSIFLKIPGINGNVSSGGHKNWIAIDNVDFSIKRFIHTEPGKVNDRDNHIPNLSEFEMTKKLDNASHHLFAAACSGKVYDQIELHVCATDKALEPYAKYKLFDAMISMVHTAMHNNAIPMEMISINYTKIESTYISRDAKGVKQAPFTVGYDQASAEIL